MVPYYKWTLKDLWAAILKYAQRRRYLMVHGDYLGPAFSLCHHLGLPVTFAKRVIKRLLLDPYGGRLPGAPGGINTTRHFPPPKPKAPPGCTSDGASVFVFIDPSGVAIPGDLTTGALCPASPITARHHPSRNG